MIRRWLPAALLLISACSPEAPPAPAPKRLVKMTPDEPPPPPAPAMNPPAPPPKPPTPPEPPKKPPPPPPEPAPVVVARRTGPPADVHLPAFTFRTMEPGTPKIAINGELLGNAPCLWTITNTIEFDPAISVLAWPPENATLIGTTESKERAFRGSKAEVYLARSAGLRERFPHLKEGESVLFVSARLDGVPFQGALRLFVEGHHFIDYTPLVNPEGDDASRLLRTFWFERN